MLRTLAICLTAALLVPLAISTSTQAAAKKKPLKCPAGAVMPGKGAKVCITVGPPSKNGPQFKGLPRRHAKALRAARKRGPELLALVPRAQELLTNAPKPASRRARAAAKSDGPAVELPLSELGGKYENAQGTMTGQAYEAAEGRRGGGASTELDVKGRNGSTAGVSMDNFSDADGCPTADGIVRGERILGAKQRATTIQGALRVGLEIEVRHEGKWTGHVGRDAKAGTVDYAGTGIIRLRVWYQDAKTGRSKGQEPTRTFRAFLNISGWGVDRPADAEALRHMDLRGPGGRYFRGEGERAGMIEAAKMALTGLNDARDELKKGDKRWFEDMQCAKAFVDADRAKVRAGDRVVLRGTLKAADGSVADADWSTGSGCPGQFDRDSASGAEVTFTVTDSGREWKDGRGLCMSGEVLSSAGRAKVLYSLPSASDLYRVTFTGTGKRQRDLSAANGEIQDHQTDTFEWRIVFNDVPLSDQQYGNVVPTDVTGTFKYNGKFGTLTYSCAGDVKAYSGEGATPLGSIIVKPGSGQWTLRVSAFNRIDPDWKQCTDGAGAPLSLANVGLTEDGEYDEDKVAPYDFDVIVRAQDLAALGSVKQNIGASGFELDCLGFEGCTDTGEWEGEAVVEPM